MPTTNTALISFIFFNNKQTVIFGPNSCIFSSGNNVYSAVFNTSHSSANCIVYPESHTLLNESAVIYQIFGSPGNIYLNRHTIFSSNNSFLNGRMATSNHIVFPNACKKNPEDINSSEWNDEYKLEQKEYNDDNCMNTSYFSALYWGNTNHTFSTSGNGNYYFEDPKDPIVFDSADKVLKLNKDSEFVKYDVQLWDQCKIDSGKYSFAKFINTIDNQDKYINIDTIEHLFADGKKHLGTGLLNHMPSTLYVGLIGNKNIIIKSKSKVNTLNLLGDNSKYTGIITVPNQIDIINCSNPFVKIRNQDGKLLHGYIPIYKYYNPVSDIDSVILSKCKVDDKFGRVYCNQNGINKLLIDNKGSFYYDMKTLIEQSNIEHEKELPNWRGGNLIVKNTDIDSKTKQPTNIYTMTKEYKEGETQPNINGLPASFKVRLDYDTNIIIPYSTTLTNNNLMFVCGKVNDDDQSNKYKNINLSLTVLGNILYNNNLLTEKYGENYCKESIIDIHWPTNASVIIGPKAQFKHTNPGVYPVYSGCDNIEYIIYPNCNMDDNNSNNVTIGPNGKVYLNKFLTTDNSIYNKIRAKLGRFNEVYFPNRTIIKIMKVVILRMEHIL